MAATVDARCSAAHPAPTPGGGEYYQNGGYDGDSGMSPLRALIEASLPQSLVTEWDAGIRRAMDEAALEAPRGGRYAVDGGEGCGARTTARGGSEEAAERGERRPRQGMPRGLQQPRYAARERETTRTQSTGVGPARSRSDAARGGRARPAAALSQGVVQPSWPTPGNTIKRRNPLVYQNYHRTATQEREQHQKGSKEAAAARAVGGRGDDDAVGSACPITPPPPPPPPPDASASRSLRQSVLDGDRSPSPSTSTSPQERPSVSSTIGRDRSRSALGHRLHRDPPDRPSDATSPSLTGPPRHGEPTEASEATAAATRETDPRGRALERRRGFWSDAPGTAPAMASPGNQLRRASSSRRSPTRRRRSKSASQARASAHPPAATPAAAEAGTWDPDRLPAPPRSYEQTVGGSGRSSTYWTARRRREVDALEDKENRPPEKIGSVACGQAAAADASLGEEAAETTEDAAGLLAVLEVSLREARRREGASHAARVRRRQRVLLRGALVAATEAWAGVAGMSRWAARAGAYLRAGEEAEAEAVDEEARPGVPRESEGATAARLAEEFALFREEFAREFHAAEERKLRGVAGTAKDTP